jgi:hypothetical protein
MKKQPMTQQETKNWGKMWLGLLIGAAVVGLVWALWYFLTPPTEVVVERVVEREVTVEVPVEEEEETLTPVETVEAFYDWFLAPHTPTGISDLDFLKSGDYLTDSFIAEIEDSGGNVPGSILCAQDVPNSREYHLDQLNTSRASVFADHGYGDTVVQIQVILNETDDGWVIDDIVCPQ